MMKKYLLIAVLLVGCNYPSTGKEYMITLYSGGKAIRTWKSDCIYNYTEGSVSFRSDNQPVKIFGTITVEETTISVEQEPSK